MTFPAATFTAVPPPADGLARAFGSARRRRNSKAAVSAFGGAVAIASMLSFLAPPGQTLVQEPTPPAGGGLLTGLLDAPRHGAPAPQVRTPLVPFASATATSPVVVSRYRMGGATNAAAGRRTTVVSDPCTDSRTLACASLPHVVEGGPTMQAKACPASASVTVEYDSPPVVPAPLSVSRTVEVGSGCRS